MHYNKSIDEVHLIITLPMKLYLIEHYALVYFNM